MTAQAQSTLLPNECIGMYIQDGSDNVITFLRKSGAMHFRHANGKTLFAHLISTMTIMRAWQQPEWLLNASALHSIYSTDAYHRQLIPFDRRSDVKELVGEDSERLIYLFCTVSRRDILQKLGDSIPATGLLVDSRISGQSRIAVSRDEAFGLLLLLAANEVEQTQGSFGEPGIWLSRISQLLGKLSGDYGPLPSILGSCTASVSVELETVARDAYLRGTAALRANSVEAAKHLETAIRLVPWVAEPFVCRSVIAIRDHRFDLAQDYLNKAEVLLQQWGSAWDKRIEHRNWQSLVCRLRRITVDGSRESSEIERLVLRLYGRLHEARALSIVSKPTRVVAHGSPAGGAVRGLDRFQSYVQRFSRCEQERAFTVYPDLRMQAWHDSAGFPVARALEDAFPEIRREILAMDSRFYQREAENIPRQGSWDVLFFYERGRKNAENCAACPVTTHIVEAYETIRSAAGLIYASKILPGTHIAPHCGPTNLRLRCHLPIRIPSGDCGVRVNGEVRKWEEGKCLIFDDFLEHDSWNYTSEERIVLIVDIWHAGLSSEEIELLKGLQRYAHAHAESLNVIGIATTVRDWPPFISQRLKSVETRER